MWELVLCWFGACNEFLGIGYFCVGVSVSQNRHIAIFLYVLQRLQATVLVRECVIPPANKTNMPNNCKKTQR